MIDSFVYFTASKFTFPPTQLLRRLKRSGIKVIIFSPINLVESKKCLELINVLKNKTRIPKLYFSVGITPTEAFKETGLFSLLGTRKKIFTLMESKYSVGLTTGLHRNVKKSPLEDQLKCFEMILAVSKALQKPVRLLDHGDHELFMEIMRKNPDVAQNSAIFDVYRPSEQKIRDYLSLGLHISLSDNDVQKGDYWINLIPKEKMLVHSGSLFSFSHTKYQEVGGMTRSIQQGKIDILIDGLLERHHKIWKSKEMIEEYSVNNSINLFRLRS